MNKVILLIAWAWQLFVGSGSYAQGSAKDSSGFNAAIQNAITLYQLAEGDQSRLYNGKLYHDISYTLTDGHPYFVSNIFNQATIQYDGLSYENIPLLYNIITEEVVIPHFNKINWISLVNEKITAFNVLGYHFVRIVKDSANGLLSTGFYEQLYKGNVTVVKKTTKHIQENIVADKIKRTINVTSRRYLKKEGTWYEVSGRRSFLNLLNNQRNNIQHFVKSNKIRFRRKPDDAYVKIAAYYDAIMKK